MALAHITWSTQVTEHHEVTVDLETLPLPLARSFVRFSLPFDGKPRVNEAVDIEEVIAEYEGHDDTEVSATRDLRMIEKVEITS